MEWRGNRLWWLTAIVFFGCWFGFSYLEIRFFPGLTPIPGAIGAVIGFVVGIVIGVYIENYGRRNSK